MLLFYHVTTYEVRNEAIADSLRYTRTDTYSHITSTARPSLAMIADGLRYMRTRLNDRSKDFRVSDVPEILGFILSLLGEKLSSANSPGTLERTNFDYSSVHSKSPAKWPSNATLLMSPGPANVCEILA